jgi:hypothetical protein
MESAGVAGDVEDDASERHSPETTIAVDFLSVPTVIFDVLYILFVLSLERRRVLHVNVTAHPYAAWAAQQIVEAIGPDVSGSVQASDPRPRQHLRLGLRRARHEPRRPPDAERSALATAHAGSGADSGRDARLSAGAGAKLTSAPVGTNACGHSVPAAIMWLVCVNGCPGPGAWPRQDT